MDPPRNFNMVAAALVEKLVSCSPIACAASTTSISFRRPLPHLLLLLFLSSPPSFNIRSINFCSTKAVFNSLNGPTAISIRYNNSPSQHTLSAPLTNTCSIKLIVLVNANIECSVGRHSIASSTNSHISFATQFSPVVYPVVVSKLF